MKYYITGLHASECRKYGILDSWNIPHQIWHSHCWFLSPFFSVYLPRSNASRFSDVKWKFRPNKFSLFKFSACWLKIIPKIDFGMLLKSQMVLRCFLLLIVFLVNWRKTLIFYLLEFRITLDYIYLFLFH